MKRFILFLFLCSAIASAQTIDTVVTSDTPNQGRIKWNKALNYLRDSLAYHRVGNAAKPKSGITSLHFNGPLVFDAATTDTGNTTTMQILNPYLLPGRGMSCFWGTNLLSTIGGFTWENSTTPYFHIFSGIFGGYPLSILASNFKVDTLGTVTSDSSYFRTAKTSAASIVGTTLRVGTTITSGDTAAVTNGSHETYWRTASNSGSTFSMLKRGRSADAAGAVNNNGVLGNIIWRGWDGTAYSVQAATQISAQATEAWTGSANGTKLLFYTTPNGAITNSVAMTLGSDLSVNVDSLYARTAKTSAAMIVGTNLTADSTQTRRLKSSGGANLDSVYTRKVTVSSTVNTDSLYGRTAKFTGDLSYNVTHAHVSLDTMTYTPNVVQNVYFLMQPSLAVNETSNVFFALDTMKILRAGDYFTTVSLTMQGAVNEDYSIAICKNGTKVFNIMNTTTGAANFQGVTLNYYLDGLVVDDGISLRVTNRTNSNDPTFKGLTWYLRKDH